MIPDPRTREGRDKRQTRMWIQCPAPACDWESKLFGKARENYDAHYTEEHLSERGRLEQEVIALLLQPDWRHGDPDYSYSYGHCCGGGEYYRELYPSDVEPVAQTIVELILRKARDAGDSHTT